MLTTTSLRRPDVSMSYVHESYHGFCVICGSVWPCAEGKHTTSPCTPPVPRRLDL